MTQATPMPGAPLHAAPPPFQSGLVPGLVWAFHMHADGEARALPTDGPLEPIHDGWLWLHFNLADIRVAHWLAANADMPKPALAVLLSSDDFQQLHVTQDCVYGIFADLVCRIDRLTEEIGHFHFAMTERLLISGRRHPLHAAEATRQAIQGGRRLRNVAGLLEVVVEHVADAIDQVTERLGGELDRIEERIIVADRVRDERRQLGSLRRTTVRLHRQLAGLRILFHRLEQDGGRGVPPALRLETGRLAQRLDGLDHEVVGMRDRSRMLQDEVAAKLAEETNRHLHVLSIVTALFLPATLVTGIFGMNTDGLPFSHGESGFLWAMSLVVGSAVAVYLLLRRSGILQR